MVIYIAGPITGHLNYKEKFMQAEQELKTKGHIVINPAYLPDGLGDIDDYMDICLTMIDKSQGVFILNGWENSVGSNREIPYAKQNSKYLFYEKDYLT